MPSPSQVRSRRIRRLVVLTRRLHEAGVVYGLYDRVERVSWRLWPGLGEETRKSYIRAALKTVLSRPPAGSDTIYPEPLEWGTIEAFVKDIGLFLPEDIGPLIDKEDSTEEKKGEVRK